MPDDVSGLVKFFGVFATGIAGGANLADSAIAPASAAKFAAIKNDLQMQFVPALLRK